MRVMVTGGAGYIGSVVAEELINEGHDVTVLDDLSKGHPGAVPVEARFVRQNIFDAEALRRVLIDLGIEAIVHMAASSLVADSVAHPGDYYRNNVMATLSLLDVARQTPVRKLVFSSTAAVYGEPERQPIEETDRMSPSNPYGETKMAIERALPWYEAAYGFRFVSLRYFNAAGATVRCGESHNPETHLIPLVLQVAAGQREFLALYGDDYATRDGTCIRDYIHVLDLANAHILALYSLKDKSAVYNLGCGGGGYSVREVIRCAASVTGTEISTKVFPRRPGDPAVLVASSTRITTELGWKPKQTLEAIIRSAWTWMQRHPYGYLNDSSRHGCHVAS
jgi:UDP-glucose 4-epimerase